MSRGVALPAVLFTMALGSALAVGGMYVTRQLAASDRLARRGGDLVPAVERALVSAIAGWDSTARAQQQIGSAASLVTPGSLATAVETWITRTSETEYWVVAEARSGGQPPLRRRIGVLVRVSGGSPGSLGSPRLVPQRAWTELP